MAKLLHKCYIRFVHYVILCCELWKVNICFSLSLSLFDILSAANGYIEGTELDGFLAEFVSSVNILDVGPEVSLTNFFTFTKMDLCLMSL